MRAMSHDRPLAISFRGASGETLCLAGYVQVYLGGRGVRPARFQKTLLIQLATAIRRRNVSLQEIGNSLIGVNLVFHFRKPVRFIFVDLVFRHTAVFLDRLYNMDRFFLGATRIVPSSEQQERRFDLVHKEERGT